MYGLSEVDDALRKQMAVYRGALERIAKLDTATQNTNVAKTIAREALR